MTSSHFSSYFFSLFSFSSFVGAELALAGSAPTVLEDLSAIPAGEKVGDGEIWTGSPAERRGPARRGRAERGRGRGYRQMDR